MIMARVTSKLQVTIPKAVAEHFGIRPGFELDWVPAGEAVRVVPAKTKRSGLQAHERLKLFDQATARRRDREATHPLEPTAERGWTRQELYDRGLVASQIPLTQPGSLNAS
jgi:AbrB family looped-hinge helix DNA binding protein